MIRTRSKIFWFAMSLLIIAVVSSCAPAITPASVPTSTLTSTPNPTETPQPTATPTTRPVIPHRIGIRVNNGVGEFYDRPTGRTFVPRGNNYIRLAEQETPGGTVVYHSTFNVGLYDATAVDQALQKMHSDGYNIVRVFLNACCVKNSLGDPAGGLSEAYIANVVDLLRKAKTHEMFVLLNMDELPKAGGYIEIADTTWREDFPGSHATYLRPGGILAVKQLWTDFIEELIEQDAPLDAIFAYQLQNELCFYSDSPPLSLNSGVVPTANGKTYDMASEDDKQHMLEEGLVYWINTVRARILELDPSALVTVGFFVPYGPNPARVGDARVSVTAPAIWESQADFIDLHPYPGFELNLRQYVENFGIEGMQEKPIIMGEFGLTTWAFGSRASAADALVRWQVESCNYGFDGWLLWTWDLSEDPVFRYALEGDGEINQALSPINRPNPCQAP